jgi:hypothetical protein
MEYEISERYTQIVCKRCLQYVQLLHFGGTPLRCSRAPKWALSCVRKFTGYSRDFRNVCPGATPEIGAALSLPALISSHKPLNHASAADCDEESRITQDIKYG